MKQININIEEVKKIKVGLYKLKYRSEINLNYLNNDLIRVIDSKKNSFIITIKSIKDDFIECYMSIQYEKSIIGIIQHQLIFSPRTHIKGASEIINITEIFPCCHYDKILSYQEEKDKITLIIYLESYYKKLKLTFSNIIKNEYSEEKSETIIQLSFCYRKQGIEIDIATMEVSENILICKKINAEFI